MAEGTDWKDLWKQQTANCDELLKQRESLRAALRESEAQRERAQQGWAWALTERHRERGRAEIAEAQRDEYKETGLLPEEVVQLQVDHDSWMRLEAVERGRAEASETRRGELEAALQKCRDEANRNLAGRGPVSAWQLSFRLIIEIADRALAGEPQAIDGDCGLTVEQQAEEAQSQAEYAKRAADERGKSKPDSDG